jgi:hypothetical protein
MKKLGKLSIYPEKVLKNNELITLKGGDTPCGADHKTYWCEIWYDQVKIEGWACCHISQEILDVIDDLYPDNTSFSCTFQGGGGY